MKRFPAILVALISAWMCFVLIAAPAWAQCDLPRQMERAAMMIERAREPVRLGPSDEARELLRAAQARLAEARALGRRGQGDRACRLVQVAQGLAARALERARTVDQGLEKLDRNLEQTDELLAQVRAQVERCPRDEARRALATALRQEDEAWRAFRSRRPPLAIQLTRMARVGAERALRLCRGEEIALDPEAVKLQLERTDQMLARVVDAPAGESGDPSRLAESMEPARRLQEQAWKHLEGRRLPAALAATRQARFVLARALGSWDTGLRAERVGRLIESTHDLLVALQENALEAGDEAAKAMLDLADRRLEDARRALADGRIPDALSAARAASALAMDVSKMLRESPVD